MYFSKKMDRVTFYGKSVVCQPLLDLSTVFMFVAEMLLGSSFTLVFLCK